MSKGDPGGLLASLATGYAPTVGISSTLEDPIANAAAVASQRSAKSSILILLMGLVAIQLWRRLGLRTEVKEVEVEEVEEVVREAQALCTATPSPACSST